MERDPAVWGSGSLTFLKESIPDSVKQSAKAVLFRGGLWNQRRLSGKGVINDLYYWVCDGRRDTLLPLQNYFSVLFPDLDTQTRGTLSILSPQGRLLGKRDFSVGRRAVVKLRVGSVLKELRIPSREGYGTLWAHLEIPKAVLDFLPRDEPFYFWDRFYITYLSSDQQPCFVHGVDKSVICSSRQEGPAPFYPAGKRYRWAPEIPVEMDSYERLWVILINRTVRPVRLTLTVSDAQDRSRAWSAEILPSGVHRFELNAENTGGLSAQDLRLRVDGMPTPWGRPVVFKEFRNGAISAMHC